MSDGKDYFELMVGITKDEARRLRVEKKCERCGHRGKIVLSPMNHYDLCVPCMESVCKNCESADAEDGLNGLCMNCDSNWDGDNAA
jgi:hypothetical protein